MTMGAAVERHLRDGMSIAMSCSLEPLVPFAAGHEIIRQGRRDLELIAPISDSLFDQLVGAGCARRVTAAWVGNVSEGLGHNSRRAAEGGVPLPLEIHDHSNFSVSLALWAAAWGSPYIPTRTLLGSDVVRSNPGLTVVEGAVRVAALKPDLAILHVQRADTEGRAHCWGPLGVAAAAAGRGIGDGELVFVGMPLPVLAFAVARSTHAPSDLGLYEVGLLRAALAEAFLGTMGDPPNVAGAHWATRMSNVMALLAQGLVDLGFIGGAGVDRVGEPKTSYNGGPPGASGERSRRRGGLGTQMLSPPSGPPLHHQKGRL